MSNILTSLVICGLLGLIGQGARAIAGLSNSQALAGGTATQQSNFNAAYLTVSLIIGFIAGVLAGLALGVVDEGNTSLPRETMLGLIAAGYAGTDFIENTLAKLLPQVGAVGSSAGFTGVQKQATTAAILTSQSAVNANVSPAQASFDLELAVRKLLPNLDGAHWVPLLNDAFNRFNMNTPLRVAAAMGQFIAEAGESFNGLRENMNYSASGLLKNFPNEIDEATANTLAGNPEAIANRVYANRNGNGDEASGDGFKFRGGGLCQLTGRAEYTKFANDMGMDVDHAAAYVETAEGAAVSGCWYLSVNGCLPLADQWKLTQITGIVNRAMLGLTVTPGSTMLISSGIPSVWRCLVRWSHKFRVNHAWPAPGEWSVAQYPEPCSACRTEWIDNAKRSFERHIVLHVFRPKRIAPGTKRGCGNHSVVG